MDIYLKGARSLQDCVRVLFKEKADPKKSTQDFVPTLGLFKSDKWVQEIFSDIIADDFPVNVAVTVPTGKTLLLNNWNNDDQMLEKSKSNKKTLFLEITLHGHWVWTLNRSSISCVHPSFISFDRKITEQDDYFKAS